MRSLWRILAFQWLGGEGSEALTGHSTVLESLMFGEHARAMHAFNVRRAPGVSHHAMMSPGAECGSDPEAASEEVLRSGSPGRYLC